MRLINGTNILILYCKKMKLTIKFLENLTDIN